MQKHLNRNNSLVVAIAFLVLAIAIAGVLGFKMMETPEQRFLHLYHQEVKDCATAEAFAQSELRKGKFTLLVTLGLGYDLSQMPFVFYRKLEEDYGLTIVYIYNCVVTREDNCFNLKVRQSLEQKYGREHLIQLYRKMQWAQNGATKE